jgi:hypothetical protein
VARVLRIAIFDAALAIQLCNAGSKHPSILDLIRGPPSLVLMNKQSVEEPAPEFDLSAAPVSRQQALEAANGQRAKTFTGGMQREYQRVQFSPSLARVSELLVQRVPQCNMTDKTVVNSPL